MLGHAILLPRGLLLELVRLCLPLSVGDFEAVSVAVKHVCDLRHFHLTSTNKYMFLSQSCCSWKINQGALGVQVLPLSLCSICI